MQKQAPTLGRLLTMVLFALSCFGLLLFLWLSFGGTIPLKPKGYRFQVALPEATQLGLEADVRTAGVRVGKVRKKELSPNGNRTLATIEVDRRFAPVRSDARAILRQKTLLGETYMEITPGTKQGEPIKEGGMLGDAQVVPTVELDELFEALDPTTRDAFRNWQKDMAQGIRGRGQDFNDAIGNLPAFAADGADVLEVLNSHTGAVSRLVRNTGEVFAALTENEAQLRNLIVNSSDVFDATASEREALAETFQIFPTFLDESKRTFARLETFSKDTDPLIRDLQPVARDLRPTLVDVRRLAPDLKRFFVNLDPLITASKTGLPALRDVLTGLRPMLGELGPFLSELNPILKWLEYEQHQVSDFISNGAGALADTVATATDNETGHYLRQFGPTGMETVAMYPERLPTNRGNAYPFATNFHGPKVSEYLMWGAFDCDNTGRGEFITESKETGDGPFPSGDAPSCWVQGPASPIDPARNFPHIERADYTRP
jgi:virulence factor Mce-like protein